MFTLANQRSAPARFTRPNSLSLAISVYRQRRALSRLDDRALADIGLTREQANQEATRPIWDIFQR